jgi:hypothetical protein
MSIDLHQTGRDMNALQRMVIDAVFDHPKQWHEGWDAAERGEDAASCPYTPLDEPQMMSWLSGHVTFTETHKAERGE